MKFQMVRIFQEDELKKDQKFDKLCSKGEKQKRVLKKMITKKNHQSKDSHKVFTKANKHDKSNTDKNSNLFLNQSCTRILPVECGQSQQSIQPFKNQINFRTVEAEMKNQNLNFQNFNIQLQEYTDQIREHLFSQEQIYIPFSHQYPDQKFQEFRRKICMWVFQTVQKFDFHLQTAFLAINIMDRVISFQKLQIYDLLLLAVTSLFMAAKYEEIRVPRAEDFAKLVLRECNISRENILTQESKILICLNFNLSYPSPLVFIHDQVLRMNYSPEIAEHAEEIAKKMITRNPSQFKRPSYLAQYSIQTAVQSSSVSLQN